jgi:hypothetical protein
MCNNRMKAEKQEDCPAISPKSHVGIRLSWTNGVCRCGRYYNISRRRRRQRYSRLDPAMAMVILHIMLWLWLWL